MGYSIKIEPIKEGFYMTKEEQQTTWVASVVPNKFLIK
jgi:hypothetical protein